VYIVLFGVLVILHMVFESPRMMRGWYVLGLLACASPYIDGTRTLIAASEDIYLQQYQMHRFSTQFFTGNIAVNDLGLVSFDRPATQQVVDLVGLGSAEAARQKIKTAAWLNDVTRRHNVGVAMIYTEWFKDIPANWTLVGTLCLLRPPVMLSHSCVAFYSTDPTRQTQVVQGFHAWAETLPKGAVALTPEQTGESQALTARSQ
jgi:hypothetical protein